MNRQIRRNYFEVQKNQQYRNRETLRSKLVDAQCFAEQIGLEITQINVRKKTARNTTRRPVDVIVINRQVEDEEIAKRKKILKCLVFKDKTCVSNMKYKMTRSILDFVEMPGVNEILVLKNKIDDLTELRPTTTYGVYTNVLQKITTACQFFLRKERKTDANYNVDSFTIKISCDGTIITRSKVNLLNVSFTIINDKKTCKTAFGNFILGGFKFFELKCDYLRNISLF